jgi:ParB family chromosome partitioning protein
MARKNLLTGLTDTKLTAVNSDTPRAGAPSRAGGLAFAGRGAVGAVTRSIEDLAVRANAAKELEAKLISGQVIVELDPATVDASFVADRMAQDDGEYQALRDSIATSGQDSPILVRPHPEGRGRYQVAFGHRRLRAAKELGKPVRAVVRPLSDRELVLAQGQENSARANLSFIERARFAYRLEQGGYDRETIMLALSADKTTVSRLITVIERVPTDIVNAIGPAPATGRDRWVELANLIHRKGRGEEAASMLEGVSFQAMDSDARFQHVLTLLDRSEAEDAKGSKPGAQDISGAGEGASVRHWSHSSGARVMKVTAGERATTLTIDNRKVPGFDAFLLEQMEELYSSFLKTAAAAVPRKRSNGGRGQG